MQIKCTHCPHISISLIIDKDKALGDILIDFSKHITQSHTGSPESPHGQMIQDIGILTASAATVILLAKHSKLLDPNIQLDVDDYVQQKFTELVEKVQDCLGVEVFDNKPPTKPTTSDANSLFVDPVSGTLPS